MIPDWLQRHGWWIAALSGILAIGATLAVGRWLLSLPVDHFLYDHGSPASGSNRPFLRRAMLIGKNIVGFVLIGLGAVMAIPLVPGPGVVVLLVGLSLTSFPGKRRWELRLLRSRLVLQPANWLRTKAGRPPLQMPPTRT